MLIQYAYLKQRLKFGKQCIFEETDPIIETNIQPEPKFMRNYITRPYCNRAVQNCKQFALHKMQTITKPTNQTGMLHLEGGWPKDINVKNEEVLTRFRRRIEKSETWAPSMKPLMESIEYCILQNNALDIYEHYFDDMIPSALTLPRIIRTTSMFIDPQQIRRPVNYLSWSSGQDRLAAAYSFGEFQTKPHDVSLHSYIWDIENSNTPIIRLQSSLSALTMEFNPLNPSMLISGLSSGQVCLWDIRIGNSPVQTSRRQFSHRNPATQTLWIHSKNNTEFFSSSSDGTIKWWDIRNMRRPIEELLMDLEDPERADPFKAIGITALQYDPIMGSRFLIGLENGMVINANRKSPNITQKLAMRFQCSFGPIINIERNPFICKHFLTVSNWNLKIWADDVKEDCLICVCEPDANISGGCWSKSRCSIFFAIDTMGTLKVYDLMLGINSPVSIFRIGEKRLTAIAYGNEEHLTIGDYDGKIYLLSFSEAFTAINKLEQRMNNYLERCSRFQKIAYRLKEFYQQMDIKSMNELPEAKNKRKKEENIKKPKIKEKEKIKDEPKKMKRRKKEIKNVIFEGLEDAEAQFLETVSQEMASYPVLIPEEELETVYLREEKKTKIDKKKIEEIFPIVDIKKPEVEIPEPMIKREIKKKKKPKPKVKEEPREIEEEVKEIEVVKKPPAKKKRKREILRKVCSIEICKPEVCCADLEAQRKDELKIQKLKEIKSCTSLSDDLVEKLTESPMVWKKNILEQERTLANILANRVKKAKKEIYYLHKIIAKSSKKYEIYWPKIIKTDEEWHLRRPSKLSITKDRLNFRQLAKTSTKAWKDEDKKE